ncbi:MAG: hypothetical protein ABIT71_15415 [Vicinamibacteraceae bacterium]
MHLVSPNAPRVGSERVAVRSHAPGGWRIGRLALVVALATAGDAAAQNARTTLRDDAHLLVRRGIPVALVLDAETPSDTPAAALATAAAPDDRRGLLIDLAARWAGRLDLSDDGTVATLQAPTSACAAAVERQLDTTDISGTPVAIAFALAQRLNPALAGLGPPGMLGGGLGNMDDGRRLSTVVVTLDGGSMSLRAALDRLAIKAGPLGWWLP